MQNKKSQLAPIALAVGIGQTVKLSPVVLNFDTMPETACLSVKHAVIITGRSRASIYRDHDAGLLPFVKLGKSTRIRVGDLRCYINGGAQ